MNINKIIAIYFSPNKSTKKIAIKLTKDIGEIKGIGKDNIEEIDLTSVESRKEERKFNKDELLIIGFPVYADRLPVTADEIFKSINGNNTPVVAIVSYGNRDYGDALLELTDRLKAVDMKVISGAAIIGQHCLNTDIATGRPDDKDYLKIRKYANMLCNKMKTIKNIEDIEEIHVKGDYPYRPLESYRTPVGDSKCIQCGLCEKGCPVNAIDREDYRKTDKDICIFCGHCIDVCPTNARDMKEESFLRFMEKLESIAKERKEMEVFLD